MREVFKLYKPPSLYLNNLTQKDFKKIKFYRESWIENLDFPLGLYFPGFSFSSQEDVNFYNEYVYKEFKRRNIFTPPRGNLSKKSNFIIIGIKPGIFKTPFDWYEAAWLFGPSSVALLKLLRKFRIYPYFTNVYHNPYDQMNGDLRLIIRELRGILGILNKYQNKINIITLGKYKEFKEIEKAFNFIKSLNFINIYHPSFICRNPHFFLKWVKQLQEQL